MGWQPETQPKGKPPVEKTKGEKMKNGVKVFDHIPAGWKVVDGANMAPNGYRFISNNKSRWSGEYEHALVPEDIVYEKRADNT